MELEIGDILEGTALNASIGARGRNRTGTPAINEAADFKSDVSTSFTTRALACDQPHR